jgi:hypothetical protein
MANQRDDCPKCGCSKYRYAKTCVKCRVAETRAKIGAAQRARIQRPRKREGEYLSSHDYARRWIPMPDLCERCGVVPPLDRHHKDGNPRNNDRSNIACLCRRCHQAVDGRLEILRANGLVTASRRKAVA